MISESARFHGAFFVMLFEKIHEPISVRRVLDVPSGIYLLDEKIPVYIKMASKRKGPWTFNFFRSHQQNQKRLYEAYGECFTCLICGRDGIAGIDMVELRELLDDNFEEQEIVTVRRQLNSMYQLRGRDGILKHRIGRNAIFEKLHVALKAGCTS